MSNKIQLIFTDGTNFWYDGNGEGNYWSDYEGKDKDGDGVGNTKLPHQRVDDHPLIEPADITIDYETNVDIDHQEILGEDEWINPTVFVLAGIVILLVVIVLIILYLKKIRIGKQESQIPSKLPYKASIGEKQDLGPSKKPPFGKEGPQQTVMDEEVK